MEYVPALDGVKYGFTLVAYLFVVIVLGAAIATVGFLLIRHGLESGLGQNADYGLVFAGLALGIGGGLTLLAGVMGMLYKVIVDGVATAFDEVT